MKKIEFVLELQGDAPKVLWSPFENPVTVHENNQGSIALTVATKMRPHTRQIVIKYHHFQSFVTNGDVEMQHIETTEEITDIVMKKLYSELFEYLCYKLNGWSVGGIILHEGF